MKFLLALVPVLLLASACGGGDGDRYFVKDEDGLYVIERLDLEGVELEIANLFEPHVAIRYPSIVVTVNGEEITGEELFFKQIAQEMERRDALSNFARTVMLMDTGGDPDEPLESIIDERLLNQAILRLDLAPPALDVGATVIEEDLIRLREWAMLEEIEEDRRSAAAAAIEEIEEILRMQGLPFEGWSASDEYVEKYRLLMGTIPLRRDKCSSMMFELPTWSVCAEFLAEERENAEIEYFVVWAE